MTMTRTDALHADVFAQDTTHDYLAHVTGDCLADCCFCQEQREIAAQNAARMEARREQLDWLQTLIASHGEQQSAIEHVCEVLGPINTSVGGKGALMAARLLCDPDATATMLAAVRALLATLRAELPPVAAPAQVETPAEYDSPMPF
jgi:hypothetical protein